MFSSFPRVSDRRRASSNFSSRRDGGLEVLSSFCAPWAGLDESVSRGHPGRLEVGLEALSSLRAMCEGPEERDRARCDFEYFGGLEGTLGVTVAY